MTGTSDFSDYFTHRGVGPETYSEYVLPAYVRASLPRNLDASILDFGCGFGQFALSLRQLGYQNVYGLDIEPAAIAYCRQQGLVTIDGNANPLETLSLQFDFIYCSHVLEHIPKPAVIATLAAIRHVLTESGTFFLCVPNAQAATGCYWAYEDFTHETLYTSGSLRYILSRAHFKNITFVDVSCTAGSRMLSRPIKLVLLWLYRSLYRTMNRITTSATHRGSPDIFSYEIKATARK